MRYQQLKWRTDSETNNRGFDIQRSYDGQLWKSIGFANGGGTTQHTRNYNYIDYPNPGIIYYRLRQVDWDGQFDLSNIVSTVLTNDLNKRKQHQYLIIDDSGQEIARLQWQVPRAPRPTCSLEYH